MEDQSNIPAGVRELADAHFGGNIISTYSRAQAIEDGLMVDLTEWADDKKGFLGGFLPREYNDALWEKDDAPVCVSRRLWTAIDIEKDCPEKGCESGKVHAGTMLEDKCPTCRGKGKIKGAGVWQDTRGRAHDVLWMGSLAAKGLLRREMNRHEGDGPPVISLPITGYYGVLLSRDGRSNGRTVKLKIVIDGDGVWIGYPDED